MELNAKTIPCLVPVNPDWVAFPTEAEEQRRLNQLAFEESEQRIAAFLAVVPPAEPYNYSAAVTAENSRRIGE